MNLICAGSSIMALKRLAYLIVLFTGLIMSSDALAGGSTQQTWELLKPGDVVDVVAPASGGVTPEMIEHAKQVLCDLGLVPHIPDDIEEKGSYFTANTDEYRSKHLRYALTNNESKAVWALRGGYGSALLLDDLHKMLPPAKPKVLIGFSDITALHTFIQKEWGWPSIHGDVLVTVHNLKKGSGNIKEVTDLLFGKRKEVAYTNLRPLNRLAEQTSVIEGKVVGGNLAILASSMGTFWQIDGRDKIILIEDVDERGYKVDRLLLQMLQGKAFVGAKAVVFGDMIGGDESNGENYVAYAIERFANKVGLPVFQISGVGHGPVNHPIPLGTPSKIKVGYQVEWVIEAR